MSRQTVYPVTLIFYIIKICILLLRYVFFQKKEILIAEDYKNDERKV